jgi:hypothetical protein
MDMHDKRAAGAKQLRKTVRPIGGKIAGEYRVCRSEGRGEDGKRERVEAAAVHRNPPGNSLV